MVRPSRTFCGQRLIITSARRLCFWLGLLPTQEDCVYFSSVCLSVGVQDHAERFVFAVFVILGVIVIKEFIPLSVC